MAAISRRNFLSSTVKSAASLGLMAGCDSQTLHPDIRPPSAPVGLTGYSDYDNSLKKALISWSKHDCTDITGVVSEKKIIGYNIFYEGTKKPLNKSPLKDPAYIDTGIEGKGLEEGKSYHYQVTAFDQNENESMRSELCTIKISPPSLIYATTDAKASVGVKVQKDIVKTMIHKTVLAFTQKKSITEAYEFLFPKIRGAYPKIAIKINCLAGKGLCTHPEIVEAITEDLGTMYDAQYPLHYITVFDDRKEAHLTSAKFVLKTGENDYQVVSVFGEKNAQGEFNWGKRVSIGDSEQRFCKIIEETDYIINIPVLKDHSNAGITFALKNFYGIIDNPMIMHNDMCDPYIAEIYKNVYKKVKIILGDAILGAHKGGPSTNPTFAANTIVAGNDPVAMDMYALEMINEQRTLKKLPLIKLKKDEQNPNIADARHIVTASSSHYDLGTINKKVIKV